MSRASRTTQSDELLHIYSILRKLKCLTQQDYSLFPQAFLWKVLDERLAGLVELASEICDDLFGQVAGGLRGGLAGQRHQLQDVQFDQDDTGGGKRSVEDQPKLPEFDEYFHACLCQLYDLVLDLHWHDLLPNGEEAAAGRLDNRKHTSKFLDFRQSMNAALREVRGKRRLSPSARRRVQFESLPPLVSVSNSCAKQPGHSTISNQDLLDNHSVFALDLLLFGVDVFVQRLAESLSSWSARAQGHLYEQIELLFNSRIRIKANKLKALTRAIKIYNDVHLIVLEYLSEIKRRYLVRTIAGALLGHDSLALMENYKRPRIAYYSQRLHSEVEAKILKALTSECLQILFNLIVCEINVPPVELKGGGGPKKGGREDEHERAQQNIMSFIGNWLRVDNTLFGHSQHDPNAPGLGANESDSVHARTSLPKHIERPPLAMGKQISTLSLNVYKSSSRILAQMDNLGEFTRQFLHTIAGRLGHSQQLTFFFDSVFEGLNQFFDVISAKLEIQLRAASAGNPRPVEEKDQPPNQDQSQADSNGNQHSLLERNIDMMTAKIRCLKFVHIMSYASKIVSDEAALVRLASDGSSRLDEKVAKFTTTCMGSYRLRDQPH